MNGLLVAPTEPKQLKAIGTSSSVPEQYGVDVMWGTEGGLCGIQRKEFKDLLASINDGRLVKEVSQMQQLSTRVLVVEGQPKWTDDGELMDRYTKMTRPQLHAYLLSIRSKGIWVDWTRNLSETIEYVDTCRRWTCKPVHRALSARPKPNGKWGVATSRDFAIHLLTSLDGIGPGVAENILDHFGKVPLKWEVTEEQLREVPGIGKVRAKKMIEVLEDE